MGPHKTYHKQEQLYNKIDGLQHNETQFNRNMFALDCTTVTLTGNKQIPYMLGFTLLLGIMFMFLHFKRQLVHKDLLL